MRRVGTNWTLYIGLAAFAVAFGYLEAAVAAYATHAAGMTVGSAAQWCDEAPDKLLAIEPLRQAAGLVMIAAIALLSGRWLGQIAGAFLYTLGIRCVLYYVSLLSMLGQPPAEAGSCLFYLPGRFHFPDWIIIVLAIGLTISGARLMQAPRKSGGSNERQTIHGARRRR